MSKIAERLAGHFRYDAEVKCMLLATRSGEDYDILLDLLYEVAKEVDDDMAYSEVHEALYAIGTDGLEDVEGRYYEYCSADIYTHDLLEWVSRNMKNVAWCDEAMEEYTERVALQARNPRNGIKSATLVDIIMAGQGMAKEFVWRAVIDFVCELEDEAEV